ncbi:hypothetical protein D3C71_1067860 [compost metagenome]
MQSLLWESNLHLCLERLMKTTEEDCIGKRIRNATTQDLKFREQLTDKRGKRLVGLMEQEVPLLP